MEWTEAGFILGTRRHGETKVIVEGWTRGRGRVAGLIRGGGSSKWRGVLQAGNRVIFTWRARLAGHLGTFTALEADMLRAAELMNDRLALAGLNMLNELIRLIPEGDPYPLLFDSYEHIWQGLLTRREWSADIVRFELLMLRELGFGLDLSSCAATGVKDDLVYVSPKSGRAVSRAAGKPYHDHLLPLPSFLLDASMTETCPDRLSQGFRLTAFFLDRDVRCLHGMPFSQARATLLKRLSALIRSQMP